MTHPLATLCPLGLAGWRAAMEEAAGLAQGAHVRALTRPDHAEEILHHLVQRLLDRMFFAEATLARAAQEDERDDLAYRAWSEALDSRDADAPALGAAPRSAPPDLLAGTPYANPPPAHPDADEVWTPARDAALLEWGATTTDGGVLLYVVNALPGRRIRSEGLVLRHLSRLRLEAKAPTPAESAQEGLADAVAEAPASPRPKRAPHPNQVHRAVKWTEERLALAREKAGQVLGRELLAMLNALPGPPIASTGAMRVKLRDMGLEVTPGLPPLPPGTTSHNWNEEARAAARERARVTAVLGGAGDWTEARLEMLRAEFATAETTQALLDRINALPGNPISSIESMRHKAASLELRRPRPGADPAHMAKMNAARSAAAAARRGEAPVATEAEATFKESLQVAPVDPAPEPAPEPPTIKPDVKVPPPEPPRSQRVVTPWIREAMEGKRPVAPVATSLDAWAAPGTLTAEAEAEALGLFRDGKGALALHEEFGGRLDWWQAWTARQRQAGRAA